MKPYHNYDTYVYASLIDVVLGDTNSCCFFIIFNKIRVIPLLDGNILDRCITDAGYRGHNAPPDHKFKVYTSGQKRRVTPQIKREFKRRAAIEPVIGHLKEHHRMGRNHLAHASGDAINAVLAAGYNFRRLLAWLKLFLLRILIALGLAAQLKLPRNRVLHRRLTSRSSDRLDVVHATAIPLLPDPGAARGGDIGQAAPCAAIRSLSKNAIARQSLDAEKRRVRNCAGCSGGLVPPSPPAEKATARQDQARK